MKTIGLIGGMSWESTVTYYQILNQTVKQALGGLHSAKILLYSVDFEEIERLQASGEWEKAANLLGDAAVRLEQAGAELLLIGTNTMHKVAPDVQKRVQIPLLHIARATADALLEQGIRKVGLLGTRYTMTEDFYTRVLADAGLEVLIPEAGDVERVDRVIFEELCLGLLREESRAYFYRLMQEFRSRGAEAVILGCTEIGLLVRPEEAPLPCFDTTRIHAEQAARLALQESDVTLIPAFDHPEEVGQLFQEYTDMLIAGDPGFRQYLDIQHYEDELQHLEHKYGPPEGRLYLAYCDGRLAGCIGLRKLDGERCEMKRLYTRPAFRGKGIGRLLVQRILHDARQIGYRYMLLDTLPFLETAIQMYRRLGFYEIPSYNDSPMDTSIYMKLDL